MKRKATAAEKRHLARIAAMPCIVCEKVFHIYEPRVQVHHVRVKTGWGRDGHMNTIPLCMEHHTGKTGVHSVSREIFEHMYGFSEIGFLEIVKQRIGNES